MTTLAWDAEPMALSLEALIHDVWNERVLRRNYGLPNASADLWDGIDGSFPPRVSVLVREYRHAEDATPVIGMAPVDLSELFYGVGRAVAALDWAVHEAATCLARDRWLAGVGA